jgi:predicted acetyltransferase
MLRVVHVAKALAARGYPDGVEGELHLEVRDDVLPANQGRYMVRVAGGRGEVTPGGRGELKLDVRGLAALYAGYLAPAALRAIGFLEVEGAGEAVLATAARVFAGPEPWMPDFF